MRRRRRSRRDKRRELSILLALSGVYGFLVSFVSGCLLDFLQKVLVALPGRQLYAQQFTNALGAGFPFCW